MFDRILKSYLLEKEFEIPDPYKYSGAWCKTDERFKEILKSDFKEKLKNFYKNEMSIGISLVRQVINGDDVEKSYDLYRRWLGELPNIKYPKEINFPQVVKCAIRQYYYSKRIFDLSQSNVIEIGGGYGAVPFHLFKNFQFDKTYIYFDIPEILLMAKYFLMTAFPEKKVLLFGEDDIKNFEDYDIVLMPHWEIANLPDKCCDLIFNAHSLSELGNEQIKEYIKHIYRLTTKYFLHFNHDEQAPHIENTLKEYVNWCPKIEMKQIYKFPELFLIDGNGFDYFEYLYEKI